MSLREELLQAQIRELQSRNYELQQQLRRQEEEEPLQGFAGVAAHIARRAMENCARRAREKAAKSPTQMEDGK